MRYLFHVLALMLIAGGCSTSTHDASLAGTGSADEVVVPLSKVPAKVMSAGSTIENDQRT